MFIILSNLYEHLFQNDAHSKQRNIINIIHAHNTNTIYKFNQSNFRGSRSRHGCNHDRNQKNWSR